MQISCERCSTVYLLDDKLIPPGGAPVQCTKCGHVFNARPPSTSAPQRAEAVKTEVQFRSGPAPSEANRTFIQYPDGRRPTDATAPASANKTMLQYRSQPSTAPSGGEDPNRTMLQYPSRPSTPASGDEALNRTMLQFRVDPPSAASDPAESDLDKTMLEYRAGAQQEAPSDDEFEPTQKQFRSTGADSLSRTFIQFPSSKPSELKGVEPASPQSSAPPARQTQVFGAVPATGESPRNTTQMFGAVPAPATGESPRNTTQMFGAVPAPATSESPRNTTQMFGAVPTPATGESPRHTTQMFGAVPTPTTGESPRNTTQMFGAVPATGESPRNTTQMFGAVPSSPGEASDAMQTTGEVVTNGPSVPETPAEPVSPREPSRTTPMYGTPPAKVVPPAQEKAPQSLFGSVPLPAPTEAASPDVAPRRPSSMELPQSGIAGAEAESPDDLGALFEKPTAEPKPAWASPVVNAPAGVPEWLTGPVTGGQGTQAGSPPAVAPLGTPAESRRPSPLPGFSHGPQTRELERAIARSRSRTPAYVVAGLALLAIAFGVWKFLEGRPPALDPAVVAADGEALDLLRRDDTESLEAALARLEELERRAPHYVPAIANQVLPTLLLMRDLREEITRLEARYGQLDKERDGYERKKAPTDWAARAAAKIDEMEALKAQIDPMVERAKNLDERAAELLRSAKELADRNGVDAPAVTRAMALYYGLKGLDTSLRLADAYAAAPDDQQLLHDPDRAFAALARAAYYSQPPFTAEKRAKALEAAEAVLVKDRKMLRAHLFQAQVNLGNRQFAAAREAVEQVIALNPKHTSAAAFKKDIERAEQLAKSRAAAAQRE